MSQPEFDLNARAPMQTVVDFWFWNTAFAKMAAIDIMKNMPVVPYLEMA